MPKNYYPNKSRDIAAIANTVLDNPVEPSKIRISIRSLYPAHLRYTGRVSGESYEWPSAGSVVEVLSEDAPFLLSKKLGSNGCCGVKSDGNQLFEQL